MSSSFEFPELIVPAPAAELDAELEAEERRDAEAALIEAARAEGRAEGIAAAQQELGPAVATLGAAAQALQEERAAAADVAERAAAELALQIAEKVVGAALEVKPELVIEAVRGALRRLVEPQESVLLVSPEDAELVREALAELTAEHGAQLSVRAERRVGRGECVVRTQAGEIDTRVAGQLERATKVVAAELGGGA